MGFVFYDTEATGPDPRHDQMLSVAAVLTDDELVERQSLSLLCRLRPHQLPAAEALLLTGLSIADITDPARPSFAQMIAALRERFLAWKPAVFAGYSSLEFDEPLLAESLRRCGHAANLTAPSRLDLQRLALGLHEFEPGAIAFAPRFDGKPSFRLVEVAEANGITPGKAHDAMGDVTTTLALARLMKTRAPDFWAHMLRMGRAEDAARFALEEPVRLYTEFHHNRPHHWLVTALGRDARGDVVGFDLAHDPRAGQGLEGEALMRWLRHHPRPLRPIRVEEGPFILPQHRAAGRAPAKDAEDRARVLAQDAAFRGRLLAAHAEIDPFAPETRNGNAADRMIYDQDPGALDVTARQRVEAVIAQEMLADESSPWMTLDRAFDEADRAYDGASEQQVVLLDSLIDYLRRELAWAEALA